eukprot:INCI3276.1.p1 GENE.INCI3276.1~~INCI3276.1.p1  ORF type:complete len:1165 (+),score=172.42 INCI3276.1:237-3731(+)
MAMDASQLRDTHNRLRECLAKFFDPSGDTSERASVEATLNRFEKQPMAPKFAVSFLDNSSDPNVLWFSAKVLEKFVLAKLPAADNPFAVALRTTVLKAIQATVALAKSQSTALVQEKLIGLLCAIAIQDFPHRYASYFVDIHSLVKEPTTLTVGMRLMLYTLEEFPLAGAKGQRAGRRRYASVLSSDRVNQLASFMQQRIGDFVPILQGVLEDPAREALAGNDALRSLEVIVESAPAGVAARIAASGPLLQLLFRYLKPQRCTTAGVMKLAPNAPVALQSLSSMISKQCLATNDEQKFVAHVSMQVFRALHGFLASTEAFRALDSSFLVQFVDFVLVFLRNHYHRVCVASLSSHGTGGSGGEGRIFPMADFIGLLFKLTCNPELETDVLEVCFEVWSFLLEEYTDASSSLADDDAQPPPPQLQSLSGFSFGGSAAEHSFKVSVAQARRSTLPLLLGSFKNLAPSLSRRLFFQFNAAQLSSLDDTPPSEGSHAAGAVGQNSGEDASEELFTAQSELDVFTAKLTRMLGNFAQINELGTVLLEHIAPQLRVALGNFQNRAKLGKEDVGRVLHDVTASLSLLCSVSGHFVHQFERHFVTAAAVFTALLELAKFCTAQRIYSQGIGYRRVQRGVLIALQHNCSWLDTYAARQLRAAGGSCPGSQAQLRSFVGTLADVVVASLDCSIVPAPETILGASLQLLRCAAMSLTHIPLLKAAPKLQTLCKNALRQSRMLPHAARPPFLTAIIFLVLGKPPATPTEAATAPDWHSRVDGFRQLCKQFFGPLLTDFSSFNPQNQSQSVQQQKLEKMLLQNYMISSVQSQAQMIERLFTACTRRRNAVLSNLVAESLVPLVKLFMQFMPRYLGALCQSQTVASGGANDGAVQPAAPPKFRFARNLAVAIGCVLDAFKAFTSLYFAGAAARRKDGAGPTPPETLILVPLGTVVLSPRALRLLLSDPRHRFVVDKYLGVLATWFSCHMRRTFPKHTLDLVLQVQNALWPLLQHPGCYASATSVTSSLCGLLRSLLHDHYPSLTKKARAPGDAPLAHSSTSEPISKGHSIVIKAVQILIAVAAHPQSPPDLMQVAVRALESAQGRHRIFSLHGLSGGGLQALVNALLNILLQRRAGLLEEDLLKLLFEAGVRNHRDGGSRSGSPDFFSAILPQCVLAHS